jgi:hypothetical protein
MIRSRLELIVSPFPDEPPLMSKTPPFPVIERKSSPDLHMPFFRRTWIHGDLVEIDRTLQPSDVDRNPALIDERLVDVFVVLGRNFREDLTTRCDPEAPVSTFATEKYERAAKVFRWL